MSKLSNDYLTEKFDTLNSKYFENELPSIELEWGSFAMTSTAGYFWWNNVGSSKIKISPNIIKAEIWGDGFDKSLEETLLHEMVHFKQYLLGHFDLPTYAKSRTYSTHGLFFQQCVGFINSLSEGFYNIDIFHEIPLRK